MSDEVQTLSTAVPVVEVTLLEDRALVVRRGVIELPPGRSRVRIDAVAPVAAVAVTLAVAESPFWSTSATSKVNGK